MSEWANSGTKIASNVHCVAKLFYKMKNSFTRRRAHSTNVVSTTLTLSALNATNLVNKNVWNSSPNNTILNVSSVLSAAQCLIQPSSY